MQPGFLIVAAGEGKRLRPLTDKIPKPMIEIGDERLIDKVMTALPEGIERTVLLKRSRKFQEFEEYLRRKYGFDDNHILYQDKITSSQYLPRKLSLSELLLAYYLAFFPPSLSRNSKHIRQFDPVIIVPADIIVEGLDYLDMLRFHNQNEADITMPVKEKFVTGSNTRIYTVEDKRIVAASDYVHEPLERKLDSDERCYTAEGAYVLGKRFFDLPLDKLLRKDHRKPPFEGAYRSLKFVPYEGNFRWIDVRDQHNLAVARERYGKK